MERLLPTARHDALVHVRTPCISLLSYGTIPDKQGTGLENSEELAFLF